MGQITIESIEKAYERLKDVIEKTPLRLNKRLSTEFDATVYLKREDLQTVRSYKIRGAYNCISILTEEERNKGVVCASAGNHAQGVAQSCTLLRVKGHIFMPKNTPRQKISRVETLGGDFVTLHIVGDTFDDAFEAADSFCKKESSMFIHPFNDVCVASGQGTMGIEILNKLETPPDYIIIPVGGGGLLAGLGTYIKEKSPKTKIIGVEPEGAPSMAASLDAGKVVTLPKIEKFVDGAAVKRVGEMTFEVARDVVHSMHTVSEGKVCMEMISLYQSEGIVTEPAGALATSALSLIKNDIKGKTVVCIVSGGNNDISRYPEIVDRSLMYQGLKHYFVIDFPQKPGALREFLDDVLGEDDDITLFEYIKKNNREIGPALVGIELSDKKNFDNLIKRMEEHDLEFQILNRDSSLFKFFI